MNECVTPLTSPSLSRIGYDMEPNLRSQTSTTMAYTECKGKVSPCVFSEQVSPCIFSDQELKETGKGDQSMPMIPGLSAPRRPLSAYNLFFQLERQRMINGDPERSFTSDDVKALVAEQRVLRSKPKPKRSHRKSHGKVGFREMAKSIADKWKALEFNERNMYEEFAVSEKKIYQSLKLSMAAANSARQSSASSSTDDHTSFKSGQDHNAIRAFDDESQVEFEDDAEDDSYQQTNEAYNYQMARMKWQYMLEYQKRMLYSKRQLNMYSAYKLRMSRAQNFMSYPATQRSSYPIIPVSNAMDDGCDYSCNGESDIDVVDDDIDYTFNVVNETCNKINSLGWNTNNIFQKAQYAIPNNFNGQQRASNHPMTAYTDERRPQGDNRIHSNYRVRNVNSNEYMYTPEKASGNAVYRQHNKIPQEEPLFDDCLSVMTPCDFE